MYVVIFGKFAQFPAGEKNTAYPSLVLAGVLPMRVLRLGAHWVEHEPRLQPAARDEGLLPRTLLPLGSVIVPLVDFLVGLPVLIALMWYYDTWPNGPKVLLAPLFILLAMVTVSGSASCSPR